VTPRPADPDQRRRQEVYLRALRVIPNLSIHLGSFLSKKAWMMRADGGGKVKVLKTEEKGSDVNLASYLLIDAYCSDCDVAVIVSNDSDLFFPIEHIKRHLGKVIGILEPAPAAQPRTLPPGKLLQTDPPQSPCIIAFR
jgi:NYN domain